MRLLSEPATEYRGKRQEHVTREEWEALFAPFPANVRHQMANLAAHNWHIIHDGERVGALAPSEYHGHWLYLDGSRVKMTDEEQNAFFPVAPDEKRGWNGYSTVWRTRDGASLPPIVRQRQIVMPTTPAPETNVVPGELCKRTFAVQHNPNCPSPWLVRLPGKSLRIDMLPYGDQLGRVRHQTGDILGFGKTFDEAARAALAAPATEGSEQ